jgi:outer membrane protein assembly factor BamA
MPGRPAPPFALMAVMCGLVCSARGAQFPEVPTRCWGPPPGQKLIVTWRKVFIKDVNFDGPIHVPRSDIAQIIKEANQSDLDAHDPQWIAAFEIALRGAWQDRGYFHVEVTAEVHSLGGNSNEERVQVTAHVNEGLQYHLRDIRFVSGTAIPDAELRAVIPMREGEIFNVSLVRNVIEALIKLYGSHGYIDFTAVPDTEIDDNLQRISLVFHLDEQKQYRVGKVEIKALDPALEARLRALLRPGEIYNEEAENDFYKENRLALPPKVSTADMQAVRNVETGIVDLAFDFRACQQQ